MDDLPTIAIRLADEGVPVRAIARAINVPSSELWQQIDQAMYEGRLVEAPRADWPTNVPRRERSPELQRMVEIDATALCSAIMRVFDVTPAQARLVFALIRYNGPSLEQLYVAYTRASESYPDSKIIDVQICNIRKKFEKFGLEIETRWGYGREMSPAHRERALGLVLKSFEDGCAS